GVGRPAASGSKCFGLASRLSGHSRVPLPPARTRTCRLTMGPPGRRLTGGRAEQGLGSRLTRPFRRERGLFPGQVEVAAAEVAERRHLVVYRAAQLERADDAER